LSLFSERRLLPPYHIWRTTSKAPSPQFPPGSLRRKTMLLLNWSNRCRYPLGRLIPSPALPFPTPCLSTLSLILFLNLCND
jgi:hypothetical protein